MRLILFTLLSISLCMNGQNSQIEKRSVAEKLEGRTGGPIPIMPTNNALTEVHGLVLNADEFCKIFSDTDTYWLKEIRDEVYIRKVRLKSLVILDGKVLNTDEERFSALSKLNKDKASIQFLDKKEAVSLYKKKGKNGALVIKLTE